MHTIKKLKRTIVFILKLALFASLFGIFFGIFGINNPWLFNLSRTTGVTMVTFVVLNTASIQLIPTYIAALRAQYGSTSPFDITPAVWLVSAAALFAALGMCRILESRRRHG